MFKLVFREGYNGVIWMNVNIRGIEKFFYKFSFFSLGGFSLLKWLFNECVFKKLGIFYMIY